MHYCIIIAKPQHYPCNPTMVLHNKNHTFIFVTSIILHVLFSCILVLRIDILRNDMR
jgi:hypothetical protein